MTSAATTYSVRTFKRTKLVERLGRVLAKNGNRGRVVSVAEICRQIGCSRNAFYDNIGTITLAQEWLTANQDASVATKAYYKGMLEKELAPHNADAAVVHKGERHGQPVKHFIEKKVVKEEVMRMAHDIRRVPEIKVVKSVETTEVVEVMEKEKAIDLIREAFVMAPVGTMPNIHDLMIDFGLLDANGDPTKEITETEVRQVAIQDMWKSQRENYLHQTFDVIPAEVKMVSLTRALKAQEMLATMMKVIQRQCWQYAQTGEAKSLDGQRTIIPPDPALLPAFAEAMRRMTDTGGNINIQINQHNQGAGKAPSIPQHMLKYIQKVPQMSRDELKANIRRLQMETDLLERPKEEITWEQIQAQELQEPATRR